MAQRENILVPATAPEAEPTLRMKLAAFVPLTIAIIGVAAILLGGVSARHDTAALPVVDSIATGSIGTE